MADETKDRRGEESDSSEIKVTDRRLFTLAGDLRQGLGETETADEPDPDREPPASAPEASARQPRGGPDFERRSLDEPEGVDFTMLINAMAQPALIFLGEIPHPGSGRPEVNLEQARVQIDLLDVLRIKCRGNLTSEEEGLLDRILYQLRMLYVTRTNQSAT